MHARRVDSRSFLSLQAEKRGRRLGDRNNTKLALSVFLFFLFVSVSLRIKSVFIMIARDLLSFGFPAFALS